MEWWPPARRSYGSERNLGMMGLKKRLRFTHIAIILLIATWIICNDSTFCAFLPTWNSNCCNLDTRPFYPHFVLILRKGIGRNSGSRFSPAAGLKKGRFNRIKNWTNTILFCGSVFVIWILIVELWTSELWTIMPDPLNLWSLNLELCTLNPELI